MSKSLGNFFTVRDLLDQGVPGEVIRFVFLSTHYSKPMDWTDAKAQEARATLEKWGQNLRGVDPQPRPPLQVLQAIEDDLNTPLAIYEMHRLFKEKNFQALRAAMDLVGINVGAPSGLEVSIQTAFAVVSFQNAIKDARAAKDFARSDALRDRAKEAGFEVRVSKEGVDLVPGPQADASKLEGLL
ncbi:MAG: cysteine--tRNA ligase, partial [Pseudomonadota bacterium]